jgi:hypothetical protein
MFASSRGTHGTGTENTTVPELPQPAHAKESAVERDDRVRRSVPVLLVRAVSVTVRRGRAERSGSTLVKELCRKGAFSGCRWGNPFFGRRIKRKTLEVSKEIGLVTLGREVTSEGMRVKRRRRTTPTLSAQFCLASVRGGAAAARWIHNPEVAGSTPAPAICPDVGGLRESRENRAVVAPHSGRASRVRAPLL